MNKQKTTKMTKAEAIDEFLQLQNNDADFEKQYKNNKNDFNEWLENHNIIIT